MYQQFGGFRTGQHIKTASIITDEKVQLSLRKALREMTDNERSPRQFQRVLNDSLLATFPGAPETVSEKTATRWMRFLDFEVTAATKGWFTDNHEREDNVRDRTNYLAVMEDVDNMETFSPPHLNGCISCRFDWRGAGLHCHEV